MGDGQPGGGTRTYQYAYDYRARRVVRDESGGVTPSGAPGEVTRVVFAGGTSAHEWEAGALGAALAAPENAAHQPAVEYIRGSDWGGGVGGILYTLRGGLPGYSHYNSRGDVVAKTDAAGSLTYRASYEAFGTRTQEQGSTEDRQRANTKDEDPTGLLNEGFRYRDLVAGVWLTRDPAGFVDGPNLYAYVRQNPWTKFDPLGLAENDTDENRDLGPRLVELMKQNSSGNSQKSPVSETARETYLKKDRALKAQREWEQEVDAAAAEEDESNQPVEASAKGQNPYNTLYKEGVQEAGDAAIDAAKTTAKAVLDVVGGPETAFSKAMALAGSLRLIRNAKTTSVLGTLPTGKPQPAIINRIKDLSDDAVLTSEQVDHLGRNLYGVISRTILPAKQAGSLTPARIRSVENIINNDPRFRFIDQVPGARQALTDAIDGTGINLTR